MAKKIGIPRDRTSKQPVTGFCMNPECREASDQGRFEFQVEHAPIVCPKCGANEAPMVGLLVLTHLLLRDKEGKIVGSGGLRYRMVCDTGRSVLATVTNMEAATDRPEFVNCPGCLAVIESLGDKIHSLPRTALVGQLGS